jgi:hypothetical protein
MLWRQLSVTGSTERSPESIFMVGLNVPADTDASGLAEFNAFYTDTHLPEVMAAGGYTRGTRFELYRDYAHPPPGCPRFCAIYEADAQREKRRAARGPLSSGPPAWANHETVWRLVYRLIPPLE